MADYNFANSAGSTIFVVQIQFYAKTDRKRTGNIVVTGSLL